MTSELEQRLNTVETRLVFYENQHEQLSNELFCQQQHIQKLTQKVHYLTQLLKQVQSSHLANSDEETPPPHY